MILVIQRVSAARVEVDGAVIGAIDRGLLALVGLEIGDGPPEVDAGARKLAALRIFESADGKMNLSVKDIAGGILAVSQFTLAAALERGNRPSFDRAMPGVAALPLFEDFLRRLTALHAPLPVATGRFGADMKVHLVNDGPVTLIWRSR